MHAIVCRNQNETKRETKTKLCLVLLSDSIEECQKNINISSCICVAAANGVPAMVSVYLYTCHGGDHSKKSNFSSPLWVQRAALKITGRTSLAETVPRQRWQASPRQQGI